MITEKQKKENEEKFLDWISSLFPEFKGRKYTKCGRLIETGDE